MLETRRGQAGDKFYVYSHTDKDGAVFYIGKGKGERAWEKSNRHGLWTKYLESIGGEYTVSIIEKDLDEESALTLEEELVAKHGRTIINWINPDRYGDWALMEKYWKLRKEDETAYKKAREIEKENPEAAIPLYREGIARVREHLSILLSYYETEANNAIGRAQSVLLSYHTESLLNEHCLFSLNRYTMCLKKLGRLSEAQEEVERFFRDYPSARDMRTGQAIAKRIQRACEGEIKP